MWIDGLSMTRNFPLSRVNMVGLVRLVRTSKWSERYLWIVSLLITNCSCFVVSSYLIHYWNYWLLDVLANPTRALSIWLANRQERAKIVQSQRCPAKTQYSIPRWVTSHCEMLSNLNINEIILQWVRKWQRPNEHWYSMVNRIMVWKLVS